MGKPPQPTLSPPPPPPTSPSPSLLAYLTATFFAHSSPVYLAAFLLRVVLLLYGLYQDSHSAVKYTDIDYLVFTDASRFVWGGGSPYARETYRYTPLLAWLLIPTAWRTSSPTSRVGDAAFFAFGKAVFAIADLVAGWFIERVLRREGEGGGSGMDAARARKFAAIWLLNPMVATISTRGSSEGVLGVLVMALLWAVLSKKVTLAGFLLGFAVHFKIYPFIYATAIIWWMDEEKMGAGTASEKENTMLDRLRGFITPARTRLALVSLATFTGLNILMLWLYVSAPLQTPSEPI
jgi:phosphatidylinositol glycan class M